MRTIDQGEACQLVNAAAKRNGWPLVADARLDFVTPQLKTVLAVWQAQRGTRAMPARASLTLPDLKTAVANIALLDIVREGTRSRFKVRLAGCALDSFLSTAPTGRFIDEAVPAPFAEKWATTWQPCIDSRAPMRIISRVEFPNRRYLMSETMNAPLAADGETPDIFLTASYFHSRDEAHARHDIASQLIEELGERVLPATA